MTIIRNDDINDLDLLPSEYQDPWPPSDEDIEAMEQANKDYEDLCRSVPDAAKRNRNLK